MIKFLIKAVSFMWDFTVFAAVSSDFSLFLKYRLDAEQVRGLKPTRVRGVSSPKASKLRFTEPIQISNES